jgi:hypothetical protein
VGAGEPASVVGALDGAAGVAEAIPGRGDGLRWNGGGTVDSGIAVKSAWIGSVLKMNGGGVAMTTFAGFAAEMLAAVKTWSSEPTGSTKSWPRRKT